MRSLFCLYCAFATLFGTASFSFAERGAASPAAQAASEVYIEQARGRVGKQDEAKQDKDKSGPSDKSAPQAATEKSSSGQTTPATCDQQNTPSAACYTATQQARPATR